MADLKGSELPQAGGLQAGDKIIGVRNGANGAESVSFPLSVLAALSSSAYLGIATATTDPGTPTGKVYYNATPGVTYANFIDSTGNAIVVPSKAGNEFVLDAKLVFDGTHWSAAWGKLNPADINEVNNGIVNKGSGPLDALRGPYATLAAACTAIPSVDASGINYRAGKIVEIGDSREPYIWASPYRDADLVSLISYKIKVIRELTLKTSTFYATPWMGLPNLLSVTKTATVNQLIVTFFDPTGNVANKTSIGIGGIEGGVTGDTAGFNWFDLAAANYALTLGNADAIVANRITGKIETQAGAMGVNHSVFADGSKILLYVNLYGTLYSPFAFLQSMCDKLVNGTAGIKLNGGEIASALAAKRDVIAAIDTQLTGVNPYYTSVIIGQPSLLPGTAFVKKTQRSTFGDSYGMVEYPDFAVGNSGILYAAKVQTCKKVRFYVQYKTATNLTVGLYFRNENDTNWINNAGATTTIMPAGTGVVVIERNWESGVGYAKVAIGSATLALGAIPAISALEIGIVKCEMWGMPPAEAITPTTITVTPGADYAIRTAIEAITDASAYKPYIVYVKNGNYFEIDIRTKDYVDVVGESRDGVIITTDGNSTKAAPVNYSWSNQSPANYSGVPINTIPKAWKHQWVHMRNCTISNMTFIVTQTKYVIHQDNEEQPFNAVTKNCRLIRSEDYNQTNTAADKALLNIIGIGARPGQFMTYDSCFMELRVKNLPVSEFQHCALFFHNWNNKSAKCGATMVNCKVYNTNYAHVYELGSNQPDFVKIYDCSSDNATSGILYNYTPGYYIPSGESSATSDPAKIPYNIEVEIKNTDIKSLVLMPGRESAVKTAMNCTSIALALLTIDVVQGQAIALDEGIAIALSAGNAGDYIYVNKGKVVRALCVAGSYSDGDKLYIMDGKFTKAVSGDVAGVCLQTITIATDGQIIILR